MKYLIINPGSASKKYALYEDSKKVYQAHFEMENGQYILTETIDETKEKKSITEKQFVKTAQYLLESLLTKKIINNQDEIKALGIRIVAPGEYFTSHRFIDREYLKLAKQALRKVPLHLGPALAELEMATKVFNIEKIVGISDSAFHQALPEKAKYYAIPIKDSRELDLRKFGYHGISLQSVINQTEKNLGKLPEKIVVCHLGGGASVTAVWNGKSVDTSMGFTPLDGVVMATRVGEIDPGAVIYLADKLGLNTKRLEDYFNNKCGLLGLSGKSSDIRELLKFEKEGDMDANLALKIYVERLKKEIGGAVAVLNGLDLLIFAGTVGERSFIMRERICASLNFLGIDLDSSVNNRSEGIEAEISQTGSKVKVLVVKTDEVAEIALETLKLLKKE